MTLVYNCSDNVAAAAFIAGLQIDHSYKHLVKYDVTNMKEILSQSPEVHTAGRGDAGLDEPTS